MLDQDALSKVYLLRKYLTDMSGVDSLVFLLERLQHTQTKRAFLALMQRE